MVAALTPQEPGPDGGDGRHAALFAALPAASRAQVLERAVARLAAHPVAGPHARRIAALAAAAGRSQGTLETVYHDPREFAPVAPARILLDEDSPLHRSTRAVHPPVRTLRGPRPSVVYDWGSGRIVRSAADPGPAEIFARLLAGHPPEADAAVAAILQRLDADGDQREVASWFEHRYADREGRVFAGISLYEAWCSGTIVEVPDVDAIAFARRILVTRSFQSPIPADARRERLYRQIRDAFAEHRAYRTLRQAAAAAFVAAAPQIDPAYRELVPRMHWLWATVGFDVAAAVERLTGDRAAVLLELDAGMREADGAERRDRAREGLEALAAAVRAAAIGELQAVTRR